LQGVYNREISRLSGGDCSERITSNAGRLLTGERVLNGIPFSLGREGGKNVLLLKDETVTYAAGAPFTCRFAAFLHAVDFKDYEADEYGFVRNFKGNTSTGDVVAEYAFLYADGTRHDMPIRRRFAINEFRTLWGDGGFECVPHTKMRSVTPNTDSIYGGKKDGAAPWGESQTRVMSGGSDCEMTHWIYAMENPNPEKEITGIEFIPGGEAVFVFGVSLTDLKENPLRWEPERAIKLTLKGFEESLLDMDMGVIKSVNPVKRYDDANWEGGYTNQPPVVSENEYIVEYTGHKDAVMYYDGKEALRCGGWDAVQIAEPSVKVRVRVRDKSGKPVPVKLHIHGSSGRYLPPMDRHRFPNPHWFEDYSADFTNNEHYASYIDGDARVMLPVGEVYLEVSKGPEITPVRRRYEITPETEFIDVAIDHVLPWRQKGWVSADTHVHFLSPDTARLEGSAEGVNVVNLLASQWGELFTNIGDYDGKTTAGSAENGKDGEYLVRVGTENRQHILGHISLLGYEGDMILPLTSGGPDESRVGDSVDVSLSMWAEQCRRQNGIVVLPHFPQPRAEAAATIVQGLADAVEMTSWGNLFGGINPYALSDWYRYLNCGFQVPAAGGTDKMSANTPVGALRTYALIKDKPFTYDAWKESVTKGITFVTCGPLIEFFVNGCEPGSRIQLGKDGGTLDVTWRVSSLTTPVTKVQVIFKGLVVEMSSLDPDKVDNYGSCSVSVRESGWIALRVFGKYPDHGEIVAAHTSAVMAEVDGKPPYDHMDAMSILDQIEGATAFVKTIAPKGDERRYAEVLSGLTSAHRKLHNMMHKNNVFHEHSQDYLHHHK